MYVVLYVNASFLQNLYVHFRSRTSEADITEETSHLETWLCLAKPYWNITSFSKENTHD